MCFIIKQRNFFVHPNWLIITFSMTLKPGKRNAIILSENFLLLNEKKCTIKWLILFGNSSQMSINFRFGHNPENKNRVLQIILSKRWIIKLPESWVSFGHYAHLDIRWLEISRQNVRKCGDCQLNDLIVRVILLLLVLLLQIRWSFRLLDTHRSSTVAAVVSRGIGFEYGRSQLFIVGNDDQTCEN